MRNRLSAIDEHWNVSSMRNLNYFTHRHDRAERVRNMRYGHEHCSRTQTPLEFIQHQFTIIVDRRDNKTCRRLFRQKLPGHNVRVMLQRRYHNLAAGFHARADKRVHHEVDSFGGSTNENNFALTSRVDELLHTLPGCFVRVCYAIAQRMNRPMNV